MCTLPQCKGIFHKMHKNGLLQPKLCGRDGERAFAPQPHTVSASGLGSPRSSSESSFGPDPPSSPCTPGHSRGAQVEASGPGQAIKSKKEASKLSCTHKFEPRRTSCRAKGEEVLRSERRRQRQHQETVAPTCRRVLIAFQDLSPSVRANVQQRALWQVGVGKGSPNL